MTKDEIKRYQDTVQMIAVLAERIGWKVAAKDTDIGTGEPGMIMGKNEYVYHVLAGLDIMADEVETEECGSDGYVIFEHEGTKEEQ